MTTLYAQPYDISASGFYFKSADEYQQKSDTARNDYGQLVEEFEIQFIDGDGIDCELFDTLKIYQGSIASFYDAVGNWDNDQKIKVIISVREAGYKFDLKTDSPDQFDVDLYECATMRDLAEQFIDEGLYGEIPQSIACYIDYDAIARDLRMDYAETEVNGTRYIYRCG